MNELSIYIALYCVLLYTQSALQSYEAVSLQPKANYISSLTTTETSEPAANVRRTSRGYDRAAAGQMGALSRILLLCPLPQILWKF